MTAGFAHAVLDGDEGNLLRLYIHPGSRREGVGGALFDRVRHELFRHGIERRNAKVLADNELGDQFDEDRGPELVGRAETRIDRESFGENTCVLEAE